MYDSPYQINMHISPFTLPGFRALETGKLGSSSFYEVRVYKSGTMVSFDLYEACRTALRKGSFDTYNSCVTKSPKPGLFGVTRTATGLKVLGTSFRPTNIPGSYLSSMSRRLQISAPTLSFNTEVKSVAGPNGHDTIDFAYNQFLYPGLSTASPLKGRVQTTWCTRNLFGDVECDTQVSNEIVVK